MWYSDVLEEVVEGVRLMRQRRGGGGVASYTYTKYIEPSYLGQQEMGQMVCLHLHIVSIGGGLA